VSLLQATDCWDASGAKLNYRAGDNATIGQSPGLYFLFATLMFLKCCNAVLSLYSWENFDGMMLG
jgi:hypothetical protein